MKVQNITKKLKIQKKGECNMGERKNEVIGITGGVAGGAHWEQRLVRTLVLHLEDQLQEPFRV